MTPEVKLFIEDGDFAMIYDQHASFPKDLSNNLEQFSKISVDRFYIIGMDNPLKWGCIKLKSTIPFPY